jgi:hypothetical protein
VTGPLTHLLRGHARADECSRVRDMSYFCMNFWRRVVASMGGSPTPFPLPGGIRRPSHGQRTFEAGVREGSSFHCITRAGQTVTVPDNGVVGLTAKCCWVRLADFFVKIYELSRGESVPALAGGCLTSFRLGRPALGCGAQIAPLDVHCSHGTTPEHWLMFTLVIYLRRLLIALCQAANCVP